MEYKDFLSYSVAFENMTLSEILRLHKHYIKIIGAIKNFYRLNSIEDVKISEITEEQYNNIMKKIIFD